MSMNLARQIEDFEIEQAQAPQPTPGQVVAIQAFRVAFSRPSKLDSSHNTDWKRALIQAWHNGSDANFHGNDGRSYGCYLRQLRNSFGPAWLEAYTPPALVAHLYGSPGQYQLYFSEGPEIKHLNRPDANLTSKKEVLAYVKAAGATAHNF